MLLIGPDFYTVKGQTLEENLSGYLRTQFPAEINHYYARDNFFLFKDDKLAKPDVQAGVADYFQQFTPDDNPADSLLKNAEDIGASKPHPDMFHAALRQTGVSATAIIHVGDDPEHDIQGARAVGMHTVWVNTQRKAWSGDQRADREVVCLSELPGAIDSISAQA